jgi:Fic family protein
LEYEVAELEKEVEALQTEEKRTARLNLKQEMLDSIKERLNQLGKLQLHFDQLLYQAQRCEAALSSTRIELATTRASGTKSSVDAVIETLRERIKQMKEVQEELTRMGY